MGAPLRAVRLQHVAPERREEKSQAASPSANRKRAVRLQHVAPLRALRLQPVAQLGGDSLVETAWSRHLGGETLVETEENKHKNNNRFLKMSSLGRETTQQNTKTGV